MTFTEAAIEVLRQVGKPLHYKKITEIAIEKNLLSHVGKTPETTMSSRLATMVRKDRGDAPITKVKPGVFALRDFPEEVLEAATEDSAEADSPDVSKPEAVEAEVQEDAEGEPAPRLPGAEVFPEEEDDDELILANLDEKQGSGGPGRSPRRRGRRRKDEGRSRERSSSQREPRERSSSQREPRRRGREPVEGNWDRKIQDNDSTGADLADAIEGALDGGRREVRGYARVAEALVKSARLSGSASALAPTLAAAVRGDNARSLSRGERPRFRELSDGVSLTSWDLPSDAIRSEKEVSRLAKRQRESVRRAFVNRLKDLPDASLLELLAAWLNAVGVRSIRGVRGGSDGFHLAGTLVRGPEEVPLAIAIHRGRSKLDRDSVVDMRGALHHYGHAQAAWLITLGQVDASAIEESRAEATAPCAIYDGDGLAAAMEEAGIGVTRVHVPLATLDIDLLEALTGTELRPSERDGDEASNGAASGNRRRRSKRRGRRRGPNDREARDDAAASSEGGPRDGNDEPDSTEAPEPTTEPEAIAEPEPKSSAEPAEVSGETEL